MLTTQRTSCVVWSRRIISSCSLSMARNKSLSQRFSFYRKFVDCVPVGMAVLHVPDLVDTRKWKVVAANWLASHLVGSSADAFLHGHLTANLPASKPMPELIRDTIHFGKSKTSTAVGESFVATAPPA